jgi:hypothetical protein
MINDDSCRPIRGIGACFHPEKGWLKKMKFCEEKHGCVEMYDVSEHLESRNLWGVGGVLVHEYSHAFHHKCTPEGYDNIEIKKVSRGEFFACFSCIVNLQELCVFFARPTMSP